MNSILFLKQTDFSLSLFPEQLESAFAKKIVTDDIQQTEEYIDVEQFDIERRCSHSPQHGRQADKGEKQEAAGKRGYPTKSKVP